MRLTHLEKTPSIHPSVYVDPTARINGDVTLEEIEEVRNGWRNYASYVEEYRRLGKFHGWEDHPLKDG